jgi:hypothetical protein
MASSPTASAFRSAASDRGALRTGAFARHVVSSPGSLWGMCSRSIGRSDLPGGDHEQLASIRASCHCSRIRRSSIQGTGRPPPLWSAEQPVSQPGGGGATDEQMVLDAGSTPCGTPRGPYQRSRARVAGLAAHAQPRVPREDQIEFVRAGMGVDGLTLSRLEKLSPGRAAPASQVDSRWSGLNIARLDGAKK